MPISFELTEASVISKEHYNEVAHEQMRPISRKYDEEEHALPVEWVDYWWQTGRNGPPKKSEKPVFEALR